MECVLYWDSDAPGYAVVFNEKSFIVPNSNEHGNVGMLY
jgi:hypothetical protein